MQDLKNGGILNNTIVVFVADHSTNGHGGKFFRTFTGQYEQNLPVAYVILPDSFKKHHPAATENLRFNAQYRLTSQMDIHQTGLAIVKKAFLKPTVDVKVNVNSPGLSLFEKIPESRTCAEAGIPEEFCSCGRLIDIKTNDARAIQATHIFLELVRNIVSQNNQGTKCAHIDNFKIIKAQVRTPSQDLILQLKLLPYSALFGVTFRIVKFNDRTSDIRLLTLNRLDTYGPMTQCLETFTQNDTMDSFVSTYANNYKLELFCICKDVAHRHLDKERSQ